MSFNGILIIDQNNKKELKIFDIIGNTLLDISYRDNYYEISTQNGKKIINSDLDSLDINSNENKILDISKRLNFSIFGIPVIEKDDHIAIEVSSDHIIIQIFKLGTEDNVSYLTKRLWFPKNKLVIDKIEEFDNNGNKIIQVKMEDYYEIAMKKIPHTISIIKFDRGEEISLKFNEIILN